MPHLYSQYESFIENENQLNIKEHCKSSVVPTIVIHGTEDTSVFPTEGEEICKWLNIDLTSIPDANHTFGAAQPWSSNQMPAHLLQACQLTLNFFKK